MGNSVGDYHTPKPGCVASKLRKSRDNIITIKVHYMAHLHRLRPSADQHSSQAHGMLLRAQASHKAHRNRFDTSKKAVYHHVFIIETSSLVSIWYHLGIISVSVQGFESNFTTCARYNRRVVNPRDFHRWMRLGQDQQASRVWTRGVHAAGHKAIFDAVVKCLRYTASMASVLIFVAARGCGAYISSAH